jgi:hypothetical protein
MTDRTKSNRKLWKRYIIIFLLGILSGGEGVLFYVGHRFEEMMVENRNLKILYERKVEEIENLKQSHRVARKKQESVIEEIGVTVLEPRPHQYIETQAISFIEKDLAPLKGKKWEQVADMHTILHELLYRREYIIDGKVVEVRLKTAVISPRSLYVLVTIQLKPEAVG